LHRLARKKRLKMNRFELLSQIKSELGEPVVKVEIDETQWDAIINKSIRWFKARKGVLRTVKIAISAGQSEYDYPADAETIVDVILPNSANHAFPGMCDLDTNLVPTWVYGTQGNHTGGGTFDTSAFVLLQQQIESRKRLFNAEPNWYEFYGKIILAAQSITSGFAIIIYKKRSVLIEDFIARDEDLFYRYTLAISKHVLGQIRSKYPSYPTAGGSISMDGSELISAATAEMTALDEEITGSQGNAGGLVRG
jgi:hypothetical protein